MVSPTPPPAPRRGAVSFAISGLMALAVGMGIGRFAFTPLLPLMQEEAGVSLALGGWLAAANYLGYLAGALLAVGLRGHPGRIVRVSLAVVALSTAGMAVVERPEAWIALRAIAGVASATTLIFAAAWILPGLAAREAEGLAGVHFAGVGGGTALTGIVCLAMGAAGFAWQPVWLILAGLGVVLTVLCWPAFGGAPAPVCNGEAAAADRPGEGEPHAGRRRSGQPWPLVLCYGVFGFGYIIPATFLPAMARELVPDPAVFGWAWPVFGLAAGLSTVAAGAAYRRAGNRAIWLTCQLVMAFAVALPALIAGMSAILVSAVCVGGTFMVVTQAAIKEARALSLEGDARLMAWMTVAFAGGQVLGPVAVSVGDGLGVGVDALLVLAGVALATSTLALIPGRR